MYIFSNIKLERLTRMAEILVVSVTYLLSLDELAPYLTPVEKSVLPVLHRMPVWTKSYGWSLVNAIEGTLVFADKNSVFYDAIQEPVYLIPPSFALSMRGIGTPLGLDDFSVKDKVWVEPITTDNVLAAELRGWYRPRDRRLVENEYGNRFYFDTYGAKWLAYKRCLNNANDKQLSIEELEKLLEQTHCDFEIIEHSEPIIQTRDAAKYFDTTKAAPVFVMKTEYGLVALIVSANRGRLDFRKLGHSMGFTVFKMADKDQAETATGYLIGAIPLIGHNLPCLFDSTLLDFDYIYGGTGDELHTLKILPADVIRLNEVIHQF